MQNYHALIQELLEHGQPKADRTGTGTLSLFGRQLRFNLAEGFPLLTTKKIHLKSVVHELLWFLKGETNISYLKENGVSIWDEWADSAGELGPVYGRQWRSWPTADGRTIDQISEVLQTLRSFPESRRMIVSAWNVGSLGEMALAPCHMLFQFYVAQQRLSCQVYCRSQDIFLGTPFNIASYALLTHMMAEQAGLGVHELILVGGDFHLYANHLEQAALLLSREHRAPPQLRIKKPAASLFDYAYDDFEFIGYDPWPAIKAPVAV